MRDYCFFVVVCFCFLLLFFLFCFLFFLFLVCFWFVGCLAVFICCFLAGKVFKSSGGET